MTTYKVGENYHFPEYNGIISKRIERILWRENDRGTVYFEKEAVLEPALQWCIVLFDTGEWINGKEFPKNIDKD